MPTVGVLEHDQKITDRPRRIKRSGGQSLVNRGMAIWLRENVLLQMLAEAVIKTPVFEGNALKTHAETPVIRRYIPDKLPGNIDTRLGLVVQAPILAGQIRFRTDPHCGCELA